VEIEFYNVSRANHDCTEQIGDAISRVLARGHFILGTELESFEEEFAAYCGAGYCVGVGNGLDAITLLLRAYDIGPGHEVIVPGHTFIATWFGVTSAGALPIGVDVEPGTGNLDATKVEASITERTRAILAVHLYGRVANMDALREIAERRGLWLFEDAAQAHGARSGNLRAGNLADGAAFSFYPTKNLGALGDGGAVVITNPHIADRLRKLRNYGSSQKYTHDILGVNSRLDEIQAAVLRAKLPFLDHWNARRQQVAAAYRKHLAALASEIRLLAHPEQPGSAWHQAVAATPFRDDLAAWLKSRGIGTGIHYPVPCHNQAAYPSDTPLSLPVSEALAKRVLSLPCAHYLEDSEIEYIVLAVKDFCDQRSPSKTRASTKVPAGFDDEGSG